MRLSSAAALLSLAVASRTLGQDVQDDCAVRAYVRAADLRQNEISHGEVRMKLVGPNCAPLVRVGLRLTLDEYAQSAPLPEGQSINLSFFMWEHGFADSNYTVAGAANISLQERAFSAGVTWDVQGQRFDSDEGFVKPFSVAMPDVQYPTGVSPVKFSCSSEDKKTGFDFGRAYRYVVWALLEDGRELGTPAGYTSFVIDPTDLDKSSAGTSSDVSFDAHAKADQVEMVLNVPQMEDYSRKSDDDDATKCCRNDDFPSTIPIKVTFPQGNLLVPGEELKIHLELLEPEPADARTEIYLSLEYKAHILGHPPLPRDAQCSGRQTGFNTLSSSFGRDNRISNHFSSSITHGVPTIAEVGISLNSPIDAPGTFFTSEAWISLHISRHHRVSTFNPNLWSLYYDYPQLVPEGYVRDGKSPISGHWAFEFDTRLDSAKSYEHRMQLPLVKPKSVGMAYHQAIGSTEQPIMAPGHVQTREEAENAGARFGFKLKGRIDVPRDLNSFIGHYVGLPWTFREQKHGSHVPLSVGTSGSIVAEQAVFGERPPILRHIT